MRSRIVTGIAIAALAASGMASSHHSIGTIDVSTPVWVKGTVVRYRPGSPHALLELRAQAADGREEHWLMEGPFPGRMARIIEIYGGSLESYLKPGEAVEVCGFRPKDAYSVQRSCSEVTIDRAHFVHA